MKNEEYLTVAISFCSIKLKIRGFSMNFKLILTAWARA